MHDDLIWFLAFGVIYATTFILRRDFYIVVREFRLVTPTEVGRGKIIDKTYIEQFDDYLAAKAYRDRQDANSAFPMYEDQQNINYLYAVPAYTLKGAGNRMKKKVHHEARLLDETPFSMLVALKKHWDEERGSRAELALMREDNSST